MKRIRTGLLAILALIAAFSAKASTDPGKAKKEKNELTDAPIITQRQDMLAVAFVADVYEKWTIIITDPEGNVCFRGKMAGTGYVGKLFDFSHVSGDFEITLISKKRTLSEQLLF